MIKEKVGRRRYILFKLSSEDTIGTGEMIKTIVHHTTRRNIDRQKAKPWLIQFAENEGKDPCFGIFRCTHRYKEDFVELLNSIEKIHHKQVTIETITCSGTLRKTRKKLKELAPGDDENC